MLHDIDLREIFECAHLKFTVSGRSIDRYIDTRVRNAVTLVWGSLRLAPIITAVGSSIIEDGLVLRFLSSHSVYHGQKLHWSGSKIPVFTWCISWTKAALVWF